MSNQHIELNSAFWGGHQNEAAATEAMAEIAANLANIEVLLNKCGDPQLLREALAAEPIVQHVVHSRNGGFIICWRLPLGISKQWLDLSRSNRTNYPAICSQRMMPAAVRRAGFKTRGISPLFTEHGVDFSWSTTPAKTTEPD